MSSYWKGVFAEEPKLVNERSNDKLYKRWLADNPGKKEVPKNVRNSLQAVKQDLRKQKSPRKRGASKATAPANGNKAPAKRGRTSSRLVSLEHQIDEVLGAARNLDNDDLGKVIDHLREARNAVVVMHSS